ncbi:NB-ARC domains-containing protein [Tanacetum coccineum]
MASGDSDWDAEDALYYHLQIGEAFSLARVTKARFTDQGPATTSATTNLKPPTSLIPTLSGYQKKASDSSTTPEVAPEVATEVAPEGDEKLLQPLTWLQRLKRQVKEKRNDKGVEVVSNYDASSSKFKCATRHHVIDENGKLKYVESNMHHQCQRSVSTNTNNLSIAGTDSKGFYVGESSRQNMGNMLNKHQHMVSELSNDQGNEGSWIKRKLNNIRLKRLYDINNNIEILESQQEKGNKEELKVKRLKKVRCYKCKEKGHFVNNCLVWKKKGKAKIVEEEGKEYVTENHKPTIGKFKPHEPYTQVYQERIMTSGDYLVLGTENSFWDNFCNCEGYGKISQTGECMEIARYYGFPSYCDEDLKKIFKDYLLQPQTYYEFAKGKKPNKYTEGLGTFEDQGEGGIPNKYTKGLGRKPNKYTEGMGTLKDQAQGLADHFRTSAACMDIAIKHASTNKALKEIKKEDNDFPIVTEEVEVLVVCQKIAVEGKAFTRNLDFLSDKLRLFCWHGCPFMYLPSNFYPRNIVAIDLSYNHIKQLWKTPKCFRRLKVMNLRYCSNLTTTPDFSEITNLEELSLEGCVNLVSVHPSIGMLKRLVVLNLRDCKRLQNFPCRVEMDALQVLNLTGCLKVDQLPEALGRIKSLTELHVDRTAITKLPSFVSSLINLEALSFGGQGRIQPRWWTSITAPFGLASKQQHPQRSVSWEGLHMLMFLNFSYCNLEQVPDAIGNLSLLKELHLEGNNFSSLPGSLSQLSHLETLIVDGCRKLEVLPELPPSVWIINASHCTSLRDMSESSRDLFKNGLNNFRNCPKLFKNVTIDSHGSISKTQCLDSSITSQGFIHQLSAFLRYFGYMGFQTNRFKFFRSPGNVLGKIFAVIDIIYHGNTIPKWFTNRSTKNHIKVELPSDWSFNKLRGYETCAVFKCKKPHKSKGCTVKNFDGTSLNYFPVLIEEYFQNEVIGIQDTYMIWLHYTRDTVKWKETKDFVTFCFEENNEDVEVKEFGVRLICDEDIQQEADLSMLQGLPTPTQHGGMLSLLGRSGYFYWSW